MLITGFLEQSAARSPDKVAVVAGGRRCTYAEIDRAASRLGCALQAAGVNRGDRVAIHLDNCVEAVVSIFAVLKASAVFVPVGSYTQPARLAYVLNDCRASALIATAKTAVTLCDSAALGAHLRVVVLTDAGPDRFRKRCPSAGACEVRSYREIVDRAGGEPGTPRQQNIDIDLAALIYTSGSTGRPKGVMLTHLNMATAATSIVAYLGNTADDVILNALPMSFGYGLYQALTAFKAGATLVIERSFAFPHAVLTTLEREKASGFPLVPAIASTLVGMNLARYDLSHLRYITSAAAPLPCEHIAQLRAVLPHVELFSMYGLTECQRVSYLAPDQIDVRPQSVGKGMPNEEVYIVDTDGRRVGPGIVGELVVRGAHVMKGYWELPVETARRLRPGPVPNESVLYTGDLFRMDEDGYLYFVARSDDIIRTGGEKVSPREVESVVYELEQVEEAAIIGVPDEAMGEIVKAIVALRPGATLTAIELRRHCARRLEPSMVPAVVEFIAALPHTPSGKINKRALRVQETEG